MQLNSQTVLWMAIAAFIGLVLAFIFVPPLRESALSIMDRLTTVTSGGDWEPPASWRPGN